MSEMERLNMQTKNLAEEKLQQLKELFPNAVTEIVNDEGEVVPAIDKDVLMQEISSEVVEGNKERYQFTWPNKREAVMSAYSSLNKTLRPYRKEGSSYEETKNLYIEGDNLETLKLLQETYLDKIDLIYVDPPYNTGTDMLYFNDFEMTSGEFKNINSEVDEEGNILKINTGTDGKIHTNWLNMMYPRLKLARNLLSSEGYLVLSIDHHELVNTVKMCDEIFGESNRIGII